MTATHEAAATLKYALDQLHDAAEGWPTPNRYSDSYSPAVAALDLLVAAAGRTHKLEAEPSLFQIRCDLNWAIGYAGTSEIDGWTEPLVEMLQTIADRLAVLVGEVGTGE